MTTETPDASAKMIEMTSADAAAAHYKAQRDAFEQKSIVLELRLMKATIEIEQLKARIAELDPPQEAAVEAEPPAKKKVN